MLRVVTVTLAGLVGLVGIARAADPPETNTRTVVLGGKRVVLTVAKEVVLVKPSDPALTRPRGDGKAWEDEAKKFLTNVVKEQGKFTKSKGMPEVALQEVAANRPRAVPQAGYLLAPRAENLSATQVTSLATAPGVSAASIVYRLRGALLIVRRSVTVQFAAPPTPALLKELAAAYKLTEISRPTYLENLVQFELGAPEKADAFRVAELLRDDLGNKILMAEPDLVHEVRKFQAPPVNDEFYDRQWYLKTIRAPEFWKAARPRQEVLVALLDDGVDGTHEDLAGRLVRGRNFVHLGLGVEPDRDAWHPQGPEDNHGTLCAGLIAAVENNRKGIAGIGRGVKVIPVRVAGEGFVDETDIAEGFEYARQQGARVISCSLGFEGETGKIKRVIERLAADGRLVVAAAGNSGQDVGFPALLEACVCVGASRKDDSICEYSSRGPDRQVTLVAPAGAINYIGVQGLWTTDRSGKYGINQADHDRGFLPGERDPGQSELEPVGDAAGHYSGRFGGTSAAAPQVAAVAATIWACYPELTARQVRQALVEGADKVQLNDRFAGWRDGYSKVYGYGRLNAEAALERAKALAAPAAKKSALAPRSATADGSRGLPESARPAAAQDTATQRGDGLTPGVQALLGKRRITFPDSDGRVVHAFPSDRWVILVTPSDERTARANLEKILVPKFLTAKDVQEVNRTKDGRYAIYQIPRVYLKDARQLTAVEQKPGLPLAFPMFECDAKGTVIFTGTLTVEPRGVPFERLAEAAKGLGLQPLGKLAGGTVEYRLMDPGKCPTPYDAAEALQKKLEGLRARPNMLTIPIRNN